MTERDVTELQPHPKNDEIYGDDIEQATKQSIDENGIREPLTIKPDGTIISGHQQWEIAKQLGIESVLVDVREYEDESDELEALLDHNRQREKTPGQKIKEGLAYENVHNFVRGSGRTQDQVGERIGMSGETYRKGKSVHTDAENGHPVAQEEWGKLMADEKTIHSAYTAVKDSKGVSDGTDVDDAGATQPESDTSGDTDNDSDRINEKEDTGTSNETDNTSSPAGDRDDQLTELIFLMTEGPQDPVLTTQEIADKVTIGKSSLCNRLNKLHEEGRVHKKEVGTQVVVWWNSFDEDRRIRGLERKPLE